MDRLEGRLIRLFAQTHETVVVAGVRRRIALSKRRKIRKANEIIDRAFDGEIDIDRDAINQVKLIEGSEQ